MADMMKKVPVREQDPKVRATNFEEVCLGYNKEEAMEEATRCLNCKNAKCIQGQPWIHFAFLQLRHLVASSIASSLL